MRRFSKILLITIVTFAFGLLGIGGWEYHSKSKARQRRDELLKDFVQVSDDFTLPKVYLHKHFREQPGEVSYRNNSTMADYERILLTSAFRQTCVNSHGNLMIGGSDYTEFTLDINVNDTIYVGIGEYWQNKTIHELAELLTAKEVSSIGKLRCRISVRNNRAMMRDFTLEGEDREAFIRLIELADVFHRM